MLLRFRFSNFRSFRDEQELSLIASDSSREGVFRPSGIREGVLPVAAIYGANASGKTNVLRALEFMATTVRESHAKWEPDVAIPREPFGTSYGEASASTFVADFLIVDVRYQYGFSVDSAAVLEEWLHAYPHGKKQVWFARRQGSPISFRSRMAGENKTIESLTRRNSLFLSAAAQNNHPALLPVHRWFSDSLCFVLGLRTYDLETALAIKSTEYREAVGRMLSLADLGIAGAHVQEIEVPGWVREFVSRLTESDESVRSIADSLTKRLEFLHRFGDVEVVLRREQESSGTVAYLGLLSRIIFLLARGGVICIDELDASLHPLLAIQLIRLFVNPPSNAGSAQLIFNTHDTNLLSADVLRRDEIWFTEKRPDGSSHLYPLTDFKPSKQENLERGYLQGRYGAIPFLNPDCLTPFETEDAETR